MTLLAHDVELIKLEGEKFDFLLHCKTCGWEGRGFDNVGPTADDMKKRHVGIRAAQAAGDPSAVFSHYAHLEPQPPAGSSAASKASYSNPNDLAELAKLEDFEKKAASLAKDPNVYSAHASTLTGKEVEEISKAKADAAQAASKAEQEVMGKLYGGPPQTAPSEPNY